MAGALATPTEAWCPGCSVPPDLWAAAALGWQEAREERGEWGLNRRVPGEAGEHAGLCSGRAAQCLGGAESWGWAAAQIPRPQVVRASTGWGEGRGVRQVLGVPLPLRLWTRLRLLLPQVLCQVAGGAVGIPRGGPLCPSLLQGSVMEQGWGPCGPLPPAAMGGWSGKRAGGRAGGGELGDQGSGGCRAGPARRKPVISRRAPLGSQRRASHCLTKPQPSGLGGPQDKGCMVVKKVFKLISCVCV